MVGIMDIPDVIFTGKVNVLEYYGKMDMMILTSIHGLIPLLYKFPPAASQVASPFNAVLSKYMQDAIFEERYQDILPCYYLGLKTEC